METLKFKLYTHKRNRYLKRSINAAGVIYNHAIAFHKRYYRMWGLYLNCAKLQKHIAKLRKHNLSWQLVDSQAVQDLCRRREGIPIILHTLQQGGKTARIQENIEV